MRLVRVFATAACLLWLTGCESWNKTVAFLNPGQSDSAATTAFASPASPATTGSIAADRQIVAAAPAEPEDPNDDLNLGKRHFRESDFGLAERHFRRAVEKGPGDTRRDAEAWLGLAASYDRLRRFELADRAYAHAIKILGPTPEILNNRAILICCAAITGTPGRGSSPPAISIRATRTSRTTWICWRRALGETAGAVARMERRAAARNPGSLKKLRRTRRRSGYSHGQPRIALRSIRATASAYAATRCMAPALR